MPVLEDLKFVGAPVADPIKTAAFIGGMILTRRQKASLLKDYLSAQGVSLSAAIRQAADSYADAL